MGSRHSRESGFHRVVIFYNFFTSQVASAGGGKIEFLRRGGGRGGGGGFSPGFRPKMRKANFGLTEKNKKKRDLNFEMALAPS